MLSFVQFSLNKSDLIFITWTYIYILYKYTVIHPYTDNDCLSRVCPRGIFYKKI